MKFKESNDYFMIKNYVTGRHHFENFLMNKERDVSLFGHVSFIVCVFVRVCVVMFGHLFQSDTTLSIFASIQVHRDEGTQTHTHRQTRTQTRISLPFQNNCLHFHPPRPHRYAPPCTHIHKYFCCLLELTHINDLFFDFLQQ